MKRYLEDYAVGQTFGYELAANKTLFRGLAASDWHTAALTMRFLVEGELKPAGGIVGGGGELSWPRPVHPGDQKRGAGGVALEIAPWARTHETADIDAQSGGWAGANSDREPLCPVPDDLRG